MKMAKRDKGNLLIGLNRLMTAEEIHIRYNIPGEILDKILPHIPVAGRDKNGNALYLESIVDDIFHGYFLKHNEGTAAKLNKDGPTRHDPSDSVPHQVPVLSGRQYEILQALLELDATSPDKRRSTEEVAKHAEGIKADPEGYKQPMAELAALGLVATKKGRGGGCWLTPTGRAVAEQL
jgi:DNA-binding IscR family transcriptional regulator